MAISPLLRPLGIASALLATCQGLAWSVLTLIGILIYTEAWAPKIENIGSIAFWLYALFLTKQSDETDMMMKNTTMIAFIGLYFALSILWMIISLCKLWVVVSKKWELAKCTLLVWSACTGIISILDIVITCLLGVDYDTMLRYYNENMGSLPYNAVVAVGVIMTIAARGFILVIVNIIFTIMFGLWGSEIQEKDSQAESDRHFINAYQDQNPAWLANGTGRGGLGRQYSNQGYEGNSQHRPNSLNQNQYSTSPSLADNYTAKIGRNNPRPYQDQMNQPRGPYIPAPDYSPPSLQKHPKSVLKSRSHY